MKIYISIVLIIIAIMVSLSVAQQEQMTKSVMHTNSKTQSSHTVITPESVKWSILGTGQEFAVLSGSPNVEGSPYVIRIKFSDGVKIPPHWHPTDEHVTVIAGTFCVGMGEKFNESAIKEMSAGSYALMPKEMRHFGWTKGETIVQLHGIGPFKTYFVEPVEKGNKQ